MKNLKPTPNAGAAIILFLCIILAFGLLDCRPVRIAPCIPVEQPLESNVCGEVEAPAEPKIGLRAANIPDFWDPNYRPNRVVRMYIEADTLFRALYGDSTESAIRARIALINRVFEPRYGIRVEIVGILIRTRADQTYRATAATPMLYAWTTEYPTLDPNVFKLRLSGKNIGGSAYLSRGSVTSAKWAVLGMGFARMGNTITPGAIEYNIAHESLGHNLGLSHGFNCCAWSDRNGTPIGRVDSTWPGERTCSPSPLCRNTSRRHPADIMGYGVFWGTPTWNFHPAIVAVLNQSLFYSNLPTFTPSVPAPPTPQPITTTWTFSGTTLSGTTANVNDGNTDTRWVTTGRSSVTITYPDSVSIQSIRVLSGFFSNNRWGSPIQPLRVLVNGSQVFLASSSKPDTTIRIFRKVRSVVIEGNDPTNNRWREIILN